MPVFYTLDQPVTGSDRHVRTLANPGADRYYSAAAASANPGETVAALDAHAGSAVALNAVGGSPTFQQDGLVSYLSFDGVNDRMDAVYSRNQPLTVLTVGRFPTLPALNTSVTNLFTTPSGRGIQVLGSAVTAQFPTLKNAPTLSVTAGQWFIAALAVNGATSEVAVDALYEVGNVGTGAAGGITVGRNAGGSGFTAMDIAEIIVWPAFLNHAQRTAERNAIKAFYGI